MTRRDRISALIFFFPSIIFMLIFFIYPVLMLFVNSMYKYDVDQIDVKKFVGLANYIQALSSSRFLTTVFRTVVYVVSAVGAEFILGLILALLLSTGFKGSQTIRTILLSPLMIAPLVAGLIWKFMLNDQFGIINYGLFKMGFLSDPHKIMWLSDEKFSLLSCIIADAWLTTPFIMLVLLAGIQGIPESLFEAADIDGANKLHAFWYIILPCIKPVATVALIIRVVDAARSFDIIWVLTQGGPNFSSEILSTYMYKSLARFGLVGYSNAMGVLFMILLVGISVMFMKKLWNPNKNTN